MNLGTELIRKMPRKIILKKLKKRVPPGFNLSRHHIYYATFKHIIRGILIDGTAYKQTWRVLDFTFPVFRTSRIVYIDYCDRLYHPDNLDNTDFYGDDETISGDAFRAIQTAGLIEDIMAGCSPSQFLQRHHRGRVEDRLAGKAFNVGCAAGLSGDFDLARRGLSSSRETTHQVAALYGPYRDHDAFLADVDNALRALDQGPDAFRLHMEQAARAAAAAHGFSPPTFDTEKMAPIS